MRLPARLLLTGAALVISASCFGDRSVAPADIPTVDGNPVLRALVVAQSVDLVIPASGATLNILGVYTLKVPAGAVCDPNAQDSQTGYATADWDAPCTPATGDIAIRATAKWSSGGRLYVDFTPALRFVPGKRVTLSTDIMAPVVRSLKAAGIQEGWAMNYTPGIDAIGFADALVDPSLRTHVNGSTGRVWRQIKHFSGYFLLGSIGGVRVACDPEAGDPLCVWVEDETDQ